MYKVTNKIESGVKSMYLQLTTFIVLVIGIAQLYNVRTNIRALSSISTSQNESFLVLMPVIRNDTSIPSMKISITETETVTTMTTTTTTYYIPCEPLYNARSILEESIGSKIIQHPKLNPLQRCSPTVQYQIQIPSITQMSTNTNTDMVWILQSMMIRKGSQNTTSTTQPKLVPKTYGGDEIYVIWEHVQSSNDMAVAHVTDRHDGTYLLKFIRPPIVQYNITKYHQNDTKLQTTTTTSILQTSTLGRLTIYFDYTCSIGNIYAPNKNRYARAGEIHTTIYHNNFPRPYIYDYIPPNRQQPNHSEEKNIDLSKYHTVIAFGDSLMMQFVRQYTGGGYWQPNIIYEQNTNQCLSNPITESPEFISKFHTWHKSQIEYAKNHNHSIAVIAGSAVWDAMRGCVREDMIDHQQAIRLFIENIRSTYPNLDIYWKSPSATMLHRHAPLIEMINNTVWLGRSRYISDSIPRRIYTVQKELMKELNIPFLDLFDAYYLSGPWTLPGDSRHYQDCISALLIGYYWSGIDPYPNKVYYNKDNKKQKAIIK